MGRRRFAFGSRPRPARPRETASRSSETADPSPPLQLLCDVCHASKTVVDLRTMAGGLPPRPPRPTPAAADTGNEIPRAPTALAASASPAPAARLARSWSRSSGQLRRSPSPAIFCRLHGAILAIFLPTAVPAGVAVAGREGPRPWPLRRCASVRRLLQRVNAEPAAAAVGAGHAPSARALGAARRRRRARWLRRPPVRRHGRVVGGDRATPRARRRTQLAPGTRAPSGVGTSRSTRCCAPSSSRLGTCSSTGTRTCPCST